MERNFKGIWIPKELWLSDDLTMQEKILLVEIDSLDNEDTGCYASNSYFAKFFKLTNARVTQIINSLVAKGFINSELIRDGKEVKQRILKINRPPFPDVVNKFTTYLENFKEGSKYSNEGYLENYKENNININNININNKKENNIKEKYFNDEELNDLFLEYLDLRKKIKAVNSDRAIKGLLNKLEPFKDDIKKQMIEESIVNSWKSVYPLKKDHENRKDFPRPKWLDMDL